MFAYKVKVVPHSPERNRTAPIIKRLIMRVGQGKGTVAYYLQRCQCSGGLLEVDVNSCGQRSSIVSWYEYVQVKASFEVECEEASDLPSPIRLSSSPR